MTRRAGPDRIAKTLVELALELHRRRLWLEVEGDSPILVRLPETEHPLVAVVTGHLGEEYGLFLFRGPTAFRDALRVIEEDSSPDVIDPADIIDLSVEALGAIPPERRGLLREAGFQGRRERLAPSVVVKPPHREARGPRKSEIKGLVMLVRAFLAAHEAGELPRTPFDARRERVLELGVSGTWRAVEVTARIVSWPTSPHAGAPVVELSFPPDLRALPRLDETWIVDFPFLPGNPDGGDETVRGLLIAEESTSELLALELVPSDDHAAVHLALIQLFAGEGASAQAGLPRAVHFGSPLLYRLLGAGLETVGVPSRLVADTTALDLAFEKLVGPLGGFSPGELERTHEPETLEDWKDADLAFTQLLNDRIEQLELITPRAVTRYFADKADAVLVLEELEALGPMPAFCEWLAADYRPTRRSKTYLEKMLAKGRLNPVERALAEARLAAEVSVFRVESVEPGLSLEVEDLLTGRRYTVHDRGLSGSDVLGRILPLRLIKVAEWRFPCFAGPPLRLIDVDRTFRFLESKGMKLSPQGVREQSHLLGHLWRDLLPGRRRPPVLQNTDGDPLVRITATFLVADGGALEEALSARDDVDEDDGPGSWAWSRPGGPAEGLGDTTILAFLELLDDRLVVEVNSKKRLAALRSWLDEVPGIQFERATESKGFGEDGPLDDRLPDRRRSSSPADLVEEMRRHYHDHCMKWIDLSVPLLGDRTPRSVCKTASGRAEVARMIRTMPDMSYPGGTIPAPRAEMLRELGIDAR